MAVLWPRFFGVQAKISAKVKAEAAKVRKNRPASSSSSDDDSSTDDDDSDYSSRSHSTGLFLA